MQINCDINDHRCLLYAERLPGRLNAEQAAALLGFQAHDIPILVKKGLLKPLGGGPKNCVKYFSSVAIELNRLDEPWLNKATKAIGRCRTAPTLKLSAPSRQDSVLARN